MDRVLSVTKPVQKHEKSLFIGRQKKTNYNSKESDH